MKKYFFLLDFVATAIGCTMAQENALPKYKGYHQLTRFDSTSVYMEESGLSYVENHQRIKMLDRTGCLNNSALKLDYDPQSAYVEFCEVLVHRNDGTTDTIFNTSHGTAYDYIAPARLIYWGASQKMVEIGHLEPNDEIEYRTFRNGFTYALIGNPDVDDSRYIPPMRGHFYDIVPFWSTQPVQMKVYRVNILKSKNLQYHIYNDSSSTNQVEQTQTTVDTNRILYTFTKRDIMPIKGEPRMVAHNDVEPKLLLSTSPNWEAKSMWFYGVNENYGSFNTTPEVSSKVKDLLVGAKDELDSISILTHWVADNIRYCGISMGEGEGFTLHNAQMNFTDRCGVCKDKAGMLVAMLRAAGFKSYAAMTMAGERIDRIPADQFNHSVCVVQRRDGSYQLLDPTWVPNVRELWSSAEQQQGFLMGLSQGADLMETPISTPENHYIKMNNICSISKTGTLSGTITLTAEGQSDNSVRSIFNCRTTEWAANLERELLRINPRAVVTEVTHTENDTYLQQPVSITYHYEIPFYAIIKGKDLLFTPLTGCDFFRRALNHLNFDTHAAARSYPFADRCSRQVLTTDSITLPDTYTHISTPLPQSKLTESHPSESASYVVNYSIKPSHDIVTFSQSYEFKKRIYQAADWEDFRQAVATHKKAGNPILLSK